MQRIHDLTEIVFVVYNRLSSSSDALIDILDVHQERVTSNRHWLSTREMNTRELLGTSALHGVLYLGR